jgi:hypothetical protein
MHLSSALTSCTSSITCVRRSQVLDAPVLEPRMLRATFHLGMDMWVIQLARLHHWPTAVYCYLVGAATSNLLGHIPIAAHSPSVSVLLSAASHWLAVGSHLLACMPSDAGVQPARAERQAGRRIDIPRYDPALSLAPTPALPCSALIALPFCFTRC